MKAASCGVLRNQIPWEQEWCSGQGTTALCVVLSFPGFFQLHRQQYSHVTLKSHQTSLNFSLIICKARIILYFIKSKIPLILRPTILLFATKKENKCYQLNYDMPSILKPILVSEMLKWEKMSVWKCMKYDNSNSNCTRFGRGSSELTSISMLCKLWNTENVRGAYH